MLKGIHLTLMVGPAVPVPVPRMVLDALTSVEVTNTTSGPSGFSLSFTLTNNSPLQTIFLLAGGAMPPMIRVVLVATINGVPEVLIDGVMTQHEVEPGSNGYSTLKIMGEDLTRVMDYQRLSESPTRNAVGCRVAVNLAKYLALGVLPIIVPPFLQDAESPLDTIPLHQGTDLCYLRMLASNVGHVFYIEPDLSL